jgi:alpha-L-rhamnosidase
MTQVTVSRIEYLPVRARISALGIGTPRPRLSWIVSDVGDDWVQDAYEIEIHDRERALRVTTGRVASGESVMVAWPAQAPDLVSRQKVAVRVRVWRHGGRASRWGNAAEVEAGLLEASDWQALWVGPEDEGSPTPRPAWLLRGAVVLAGRVRTGRVYATARGLYELEINGRRVGDDALAPGWSSYRDRLRYQTYDVTEALRPGHNVVGGWLADGWYRGRVGWADGVRDLYGKRIALLAQLEVEYLDGTREVFGSDDTWLAASSPITATGLYEGETYDARLERPGWSLPGAGPTGWSAVVTEALDASAVVAPTGPPVRATEIVRPVRRELFSSGILVDVGQNLAGRLRLRVHGAPGDRVVLRHAEVLEDSEIATRPLRTADATDTYVIKGGGAEEWEPRFTTHGFRFAEISGLANDDCLEDVVAVVYHTDMERTGWFSCSEPLLNRLHDNVVWSMRGNFVHLPTDCPQRDERLGWTGDIGVFAPTATFLYDCEGMLASWLADLAKEQRRYGTVPHYVPYVPQASFPLAPAAVWGDAAVLVPWALYQGTGDLGLLETQWESMAAWVEQVIGLAGDTGLWDSGFQFGDWLDPAAPADTPALALTDKYLVSSAYHVLTLDVMAAVAGLLGRAEDCGRYVALAARARSSFVARYVGPDGQMTSDTQTAYALALEVGLFVDERQREWAGRRLAALVEANDHRIGTGFVGTPMICDALTNAGRLDTAYQLLLQTKCPSWLFPVTMGATTIWERWDSQLPDGSINPGLMTSFNHYALGAVADWLHRTVAGLAPAQPGYRSILVKPQPGGGLTDASAKHLTPYGAAEVAWQRQGSVFSLTVVVPVGTTARVQLPGQPPDTTVVGPGSHVFTCAYRPAADD